MQEKTLNICILFFCFLSIITVDISTVEELHKALAKARPGQIISIAPGEYDFSIYNGMNQYHLDASGDKTRPITIVAQDPDNPPILRGPSMVNDFIIHITGDYWVIDNIKLAFGSKAIVLESANHNVFRNVEIFSIGSNAINIRHGSSYNLFQNCYIHNTGGVGILIGLSHETFGYNRKNEHNTIEGCIFRNTTSKHISIYEYSNENEVFNCAFYGEGINGKYNTNSLIKISGSDNYIHDNVGFRNKNANIEAAFEVEKIVEDSGDGNKFVNNILFMDGPYGEKSTEKRLYVVDGVGAEFSVKNNKVDYGEGLINADTKEFYNSELVNFLE